MIWIVTWALVVHLAFYILVYSRLARYQNPDNHQSAATEAVSIVICYHNEAKKIDRYLPEILSQPAEEIILVDDCSDDDTLQRLQKYSSDRVKVLAITEKTKGKKHALALGIKEARNDAILLTDADCRPSSVIWAKGMMARRAPFVLGYGPMEKQEGWIALFSRFETYLTALQYLSYTLAGIPYMGVGRNMKIDRSIITNGKHKIQGTQLASGDDDLMINALANRQNTEICIDPQTFVYSAPKTTLSAYLKQKSRHISTSIYFRLLHKLLLGAFSASQMIFYAGFLGCMILGILSLKIALLLLLIKWTIQQSVNYGAMKKLKEESLFPWIPVLDICHAVYLFILPLYYWYTKNDTRWN